MKKSCLLFVIFLSWTTQARAYEVVYALNCGGRDFIDTSGIEYEEDTLTEGYRSNHGDRYTINRVLAEDATLYQTER